jgi:hypothetical protein
MESQVVYDIAPKEGFANCKHAFSTQWDQLTPDSGAQVGLSRRSPQLNLRVALIARSLLRSLIMKCTNQMGPL